MEPAPEWTSAVARSCAVVAAAVQSARPEGGPPPRSVPVVPQLIAAAGGPEGQVWQYAVEEMVRQDQEEREDEEGQEEREEEQRADFVARPAPEFSAAGGLLDAGGANDYIAAVAARGTVACFNSARRSRGTAPLPWPAAGISCGCDDSFYGAAFRRGGGAVCIWNLEDASFGGGGPMLGLPPGEVFDAAEVIQVAGLPPGDPVVAVEAGDGVAFARTASGAVYGWGGEFAEAGLAPTRTTAIPVASRHRVRRIVGSPYCLLAETEHDQLAYLDCYHSDFDRAPELVPVRLRRRVAFPLRHAAAGCPALILADALGAVFRIYYLGSPRKPKRVRLPEGQRAVRVAGGRSGAMFGPALLVALTESGELWDCHRSRARSISAAHPGLPLGLQPCGGFEAERILLLPDRCCGKARLRLCARIAVRLGLPCDPLREVLPRYAVASCYIVGPPHDPFSWPDDAGGGGAAFGR
eukprot:TRINITY_DN15096_c0_g1_i3.p1 TRINITY_DN15096_c0_g1~~TRINITY_DN15096_c0_g1_i3.p1  ORF type:complete len:467 (+),score=86.06 TRINITY_DN15096_c0_g1_i3:65-1465(+)